jgi:hypothetical protein
VWLVMLGLDFLLNGALFARLYQGDGGVMLAPTEAFRRIPFGYLASATERSGGGQRRLQRSDHGRLHVRRMAVSRNGMISQVSNASQEIDSIIKELRDWRGETLARLRASIKKASPAVVEEVKWKKPSNPAGVPVWSREGIVCIGEALKNSVRLTFPKGALIADPKKLFNARLDSKTTRAIDVRAGEAVAAGAFAALIRDAVRLNVSKVRGR